MSGASHRHIQQPSCFITSELLVSEHEGVLAIAGIATLSRSHPLDLVGEVSQGFEFVEVDRRQTLPVGA